jgi:hypothetical protein
MRRGKRLLVRPLQNTLFFKDFDQDFLTYLIDQDVLAFHSDLKKYRFLFAVCDHPFHRKKKKNTHIVNYQFFLVLVIFLRL